MSSVTRVPKSHNPILGAPSRLKLAVFAINCSGGSSMSDVPGVVQVEWQEQIAIARAAEEAGFDALVPVARWKGMGGRVNFNHRSFEPLTWAAGLAASTTRIGVFATSHVPTVHPVRLAKTVATIDHISGGRFTLNIVAGWNTQEIGMFGLEQLEHDERYDFADEWISLAKALWSTEGELDWEGKYFRAPGAYSEPKPLQEPCPVLMSAGSSPRGQDFAAKHTDVIFVATADAESSGRMAESVKSLARDHYDRKVSVFGQVFIICDDDGDVARARFDELVHERGDWEGVQNLLDILVPNSRSADWSALAANLIGGYGAMALVGTPEEVVEGIADLAEAGLDGLTMSWPDYLEGIRQYRDVLRPRLVAKGLRAG
ncbi:LLM class flavin-dependent oxidoreductase [Acidimicrobiaceae bacterium USS-CC1]|uniref:LLM class flavin-dependent oxidoreductase n=1 Tax=Acidiferrimicrobium australe TaxID=2664430 RepID=A0ABW9QP08_9ACTN|nr:LLM class flavin-dependent oxidoreductase [Acidiferrimicrobium australe]